ncbi:HIT family protein [Methylosinus sp. Ce-a6]|uniref:HIT family protein n=1 Tax=Methylosinus sp. Ce-a6 TaxID=2172005 RepID=UPI0013589865|nr:HIT family protein [Methylosinus sp. Ce-a6]
MISCPFCSTHSLALLGENRLAFAIRDKVPARPLHSLIVTKRHVSDIFEATPEEREALHLLAAEIRAAIRLEDPKVEGFNFGSNIGIAAGQKIFHAHVHLIPRRSGDTPPPPASPDD